MATAATKKAERNADEIPERLTEFQYRRPSTKTAIHIKEHKFLGSFYLTMSPTWLRTVVDGIEHYVAPQDTDAPLSLRTEGLEHVAKVLSRLRLSDAERFAHTLKRVVAHLDLLFFIDRLDDQSPAHDRDLERCVE